VALQRLLDFGSGYDALLRQTTGRGARETMQFGVFGCGPVCTQARIAVNTLAAEPEHAALRLAWPGSPGARHASGRPAKSLLHSSRRAVSTMPRCARLPGCRQA